MHIAQIDTQHIHFDPDNVPPMRISCDACGAEGVVPSFLEALSNITLHDCPENLMQFEA